MSSLEYSSCCFITSSPISHLAGYPLSFSVSDCSIDDIDFIFDPPIANKGDTRSSAREDNSLIATNRNHHEEVSIKGGKRNRDGPFDSDTPLKSQTIPVFTQICARWPGATSDVSRFPIPIILLKIPRFLL